ncbi:MAG: hypothetical protein FJX25_00580 [Alphaproteobacteria bacterium]|nr:hypothetical protein [Alphaproteobacteria bacterium]
MGKHSGKIMFAENDVTEVMTEREAHPVKRVLDANSREVVGWLYKWNTGSLAVMWKGERRENVIYE